MSDVDEGLSEVEINDEESDERNANFSELSDDDVDSGWTDVEGSDNSKEMSASELENGFENEIRRRGYQPLPDSPPDSDYFVSPSVDETFYQSGLNFIKREYDALLQDHFSHTRRRDNEFHFEYKPNPIDLTDENIAKIKESMAKFTLPLPPSMECNVNDETFKSIFQKIFHGN